MDTKNDDVAAPKPDIPAALQPLRPGDRLKAVLLGVTIAAVLIGMSYWLLADNMK